MSQDGDDKDKVVPLTRRGSASKDEESGADLRVKTYITRLVDARSGDETDTCNERQPNSSSVFSANDLDAIEDEELFQKRFGFSLGSVGRERLFSAIYQYDISDVEVRRLGKSKSIQWDGETMKITPSWLLVATGGY